MHIVERPKSEIEIYVHFEAEETSKEEKIDRKCS